MNNLTTIHLAARQEPGAHLQVAQAESGPYFTAKGERGFE